MCRTLRFEGHSDDTFGEYDVTREDHDNSNNGKPIMFRVTADGESLIVVGHYAPGPLETWLIGVARDGEDKPLPRWGMRIDPSDIGYGHALLIDVPDDVTVQHIPQWGSP